ncbi:MAG TPA: ATP-binding protein [Azospirillaceae bacterium]|nr:ATP-binding protein [Azospirillaceae bacterium]
MTQGDDAAALTFRGGSGTATVLRHIDWASNPLGPVSGWPQSLRATIRTLLASRYPMVLVWGPDFIQFYNDSYAELIGDRHPAALGGDIRITLAESWDTLGPMIDTVMRTGEANWTPSLLLLMNRAGYAEEAYFSVSHAPAEDDEGRVAGMLAVCSEVTPQVLADRRTRLLRLLATSAAQARDVATACRDVMATLEANPADVPFALLYRRDPATGAAVRAGTSGIGTARAAGFGAVAGAAFDRWRDGPERHDVEVGAAGGDPLPGGPWGMPVRCATVLPVGIAGDAAGAALIVGVNPNRALDEAHRSFQELLASQLASALSNAQAHEANARAREAERRRAEALAELDRAKTAFFANVSHEFRTPLTLMLGPLEELRGVPRPPAEAALIEVVHRNGLRLHKLVDALLDFARIEEGGLRPDIQAVDLSALTADLASAFRSACERAGLTLRVDCPPLPGPVAVDPEMWEKVVLNLVSNAVKYTPAGGITVTLRPTPEGGVALTVADTGIGIALPEQPRIFERFHRVPGQRGRSHEGTGIGLALVRELLRLHGGDAAVESAPGKGSVFTALLPAGAMASGEVRPAGGSAARRAAHALEARQWMADTAEPGAADAADATAPLVLVADDNGDMRAYLVRLLEPRFRVMAVADGAMALEAARRQRPDLVLSDVMMPGPLDGFGLLRALRACADTAAMPVILLSARAGMEARVEGLQAGADDYLVKPFQAQELLARIEGTLRLAELRRRMAERERELLAAADGARAKALILESITDAFYALDRDWRFTFVNHRAEEYFGVPRTDLLGRGIWDAFPVMRGTAFEREYRRAMGEGRTVAFQVPSPFSRRWVEVHAYPAEDQGLAVYFRDVTDRRRAELALAEKAAELEAVLDAVPAAIWVAKGPEGAVRSNRFAQELLWPGGAPPEPRTASERPRGFRVLEENRELTMKDLPVVRASRGEDIRDFEAMVVRDDGSSVHILGNATPLRDGDGACWGGVAAFVDISERKQAEARQRLLLDELNHRVKNTLATVQSLIAQTFRATPDPAAFREALEGRLLALSEAHNLLTENHWRGVDLRAIVERALRPYRTDAGSLRLSGPAVMLDAAQAVLFGLIIHELATNACKYGALTSAGGRIEVDWTLAGAGEGGMLDLRWTERGGPAVAPPTRTGFGTRLLQRGIAAQPGGEVRLDYRREGLRCQLRLAAATSPEPALPVPT